MLVDISICTEHVQALKCAQRDVVFHVVHCHVHDYYSGRIDIHEYSLHGAAHMSIHAYVYTSTSRLLYLM